MNELVEMLSIGTLMAYTLVSICVLLLRYRPVNHDGYQKLNYDHELFTEFLRKMFRPETEANLFSFKIVTILTSIGTCAIFCFCLALTFLQNIKTWYSVTLLIVLIAIFVTTGILIWAQPQITNIQTFKVSQ